MASIRRTLSPLNHDRFPSHHQNGSASSPSQKPFTSRRALHHRPWRKPIFRCLASFFVGILLGVLPFGHIEEIQTHDFSPEIRPRPRPRPEPEPILARGEEFNRETSIERPRLINSSVDFNGEFDHHPRKLLIVVTPTYNRALQGYYLNRLGQVLRLVKPPVLWVVVEMSAQSPETAGILRGVGVMYRHLVCKANFTDAKDRGVQQRNTALEHIELHRLDGVVYFADDDNVYSLELFERIRDISRFGTWPVAMLAHSKNKAILEGPVCSGTKVIGWHTNEKSKRLRRFHVDMSGFAFNSTILWDPRRWKRPWLSPIRQLDTVKEGFQETTFIEQVVADESQMEGVPDGCGKIMNWHLHLDAHGAAYPRGWFLKKHLDADHAID